MLAKELLQSDWERLMQNDGSIPRKRDIRIAKNPLSVSDPSDRSDAKNRNSIEVRKMYSNRLISPCQSEAASGTLLDLLRAYPYTDGTTSNDELGTTGPPQGDRIDCPYSASHRVARKEDTPAAVTDGALLQLERHP